MTWSATTRPMRATERSLPRIASRPSPKNHCSAEQAPRNSKFFEDRRSAAGGAQARFARHRLLDPGLAALTETARESPRTLGCRSECVNPCEHPARVAWVTRWESSAHGGFPPTHPAHAGTPAHIRV